MAKNDTPAAPAYERQRPIRSARRGQLSPRYELVREAEFDPNGSAPFTAEFGSAEDLAQERTYLYSAARQLDLKVKTRNPEGYVLQWWVVGELEEDEEAS